MGRAPSSGKIGVLAKNRAIASSDCSFTGRDGDAPVIKEKSFSVPNRLRLLVRPNLISDIRECSSAMCEAATPTRVSIWHTTSGNTEGNLFASRIGIRTGRRDRSLMKIRAWRRPIRRVLPYQSPSRVVDSTSVRSSTCFSRARSSRVHRSTITMVSVPRPMQFQLILEAAGTFPNVTRRERLATVPSAKMAAEPGPDRGGEHRVPPPPTCLRELGRFLRIPEDVSGVDERPQAPPYQRVSIRSRAPPVSYENR